MSAALMVAKGTFSDFRLVKTRQVAQIVVEIPIEEADAALASLGGLPRSDSERWVAIAPLDSKNVANAGNAKERRAFFELPFPQQAALKAKDADFQRWITGGRASELDCIDGIRRRCGVTTRADILPGTDAGNRWLALLREFEGVYG